MQSMQSKQDTEELGQTGKVKELLQRFTAAQQSAEKAPHPARPRAVISPYKVSDRPAMDFQQKQEMVETILRKAVRNPGELNAAQREDLDRTSKAIGRKIKNGMAKFAVKALDQCRLM
nr:hypothetical protein BaRGS_004145 [Batillaria attramentaria]